MNMSYEKYIKLVPKETVDFVNLSLKLFNTYIIKDYAIVLNKTLGEYISDRESKIFACLLFARYHLGNNDRTSLILNGLEVKEAFINFIDKQKLDEKEINYDDVFSKIFSIFIPFKYPEDYIFLTPERIIYEYHEKFKGDISLQKIFKKSPWHKMFEDDYFKHIQSTEKELIRLMELNFYKDLSYELIVYLEKAAQIFRFFEENQNTFSFNDIDVASLLLSIYYLKDNKLATFFESMGLTKNICTSALLGNYDLKTYDMAECVVLSKYFQKYLNDGLNKDIDRKNLTIEKVISNIFDRNFTNSFIIEAILHKAGLSISDFEDLENKIKNFEQEYEAIEKKNKLDEFFGNTPNETTEFVEFVSKIHQFIKMNMNSKCQKYINNEQDMKVLSFFIGGYFVPNDFICYFKENGITQEKIMNILGISIRLEEIEQIGVDIDLIVNSYKDIVFGYFKTEENVDINAVLFSLGNSHNIKSDFILKIVKDINPNLRISDNFLNFVTDYNKNKQEIRKYTLEKKFFGDMQKESIEFIKKVSQTYQALENSNETVQFTKDDLIQISIYYTAIVNGSSFLETLKNKSIGELLNINNDLISKYSFDIDIIYNLFGKYIFGGKNKDKNKCDITKKDIYTNIFVKGNCSIFLEKFLDDIGFDYKRFTNFDESFINYKNQIIIQNIKAKIHYSSLKYYERISQIYKNLLNMAKDSKLVYNISENTNEIKNAACLLSILINKHNSIQKHLSLLSKRGITLESYLEYLNIDIDDFNKYKIEEIDYLLIDKEFKDYTRTLCVDTIVRLLFEKCGNGYLYESFIKYLNQSPEIIAEEIRTGEEIIVPLSKDEQINYFMTIPIDTIDYNPNSISRFGLGLADHSLMIANEFINIAINDDNEKLLNIQEEINKLKRKPSIFSRKKTMSEKIANNKAILDNLNHTLKENEERMIEVIDHFGYLKKLIASYVYRLDKYIKVAENAIHDFESIVPNNQNGLENIDNRTILQALHDKLNDYQTSLVISVAQYQKISLLLNTYFINLNKTTNARNTVIPNLYIELSIRDGIVLEQESIAELNSINDLLSSLVKTNNQMLDKSTFQIRSKDTEVPKELIESIRNELSSQDLITLDESIDNDSKQITKK